MKVIFGIVYAISMVLTYLARFMAVGTVLLDTTEQQNELYSISNVNTFLIICYIIMVFCSIILGIKLKRNWLFVFPLLAGIFDVILPFVIIVPTILMLAGLLCGLILNRYEKVVT